MSAATDASRIGPTAMTRASTSSELQAAVAPAPPPEEPRPARSAFGELLLLRRTAFRSATGRIPSIAIAEEVGRALRGALLRHADDPPPAVLSGHHPDGRPLDRAHAAFLTLPDLRSGSGTVAAAAVALPRDIDLPDLQAILLAAARWERSGMRLWLGRLGEIAFERAEPRESDLAPWLGPAKRWASVTPVALDRNPGNLLSRDAGKATRAVRRATTTIAEACAHIGLPAPAEIRMLRRSRLAGTPPLTDFTPYPRSSTRYQRVCVHVDLSFAEPIAGPLLLGVGRHTGIGLCWSMSAGSSHTSASEDRLAPRAEPRDREGES